MLKTIGVIALIGATKESYCSSTRKSVWIGQPQGNVDYVLHVLNVTTHQVWYYYWTLTVEINDQFLLTMRSGICQCHRPLPLLMTSDKILHTTHRDSRFYACSTMGGRYHRWATIPIPPTYVLQREDRKGIFGDPKQSKHWNAAWSAIRHRRELREDGLSWALHPQSRLPTSHHTSLSVVAFHSLERGERVSKPRWGSSRMHWS